MPRDPNDGKDVILEVKAGEGGDESALFAGRPAADVPALRRAAAAGRPRSLDSTMTGLGGYKDVTVAVKGSAAARAPGRG